MVLVWSPNVKELADYIKILGSVLLHKEPKAQRNSAVVEHQIDNVEPVLHFLLLFHCFFPGWQLDYLHIRRQGADNSMSTEQPNYLRCKDISLFCASTENVAVIASIVAGAVDR